MIDLTPLDVRNKRGDFKKIMRGYDPQEVDVFLELAAERLEQLVRENLQLRDRTQALQTQVEAQAGREQAVQNALVTAQELRADIQAQSQREADHILKEAEIEARRVLAEADQEVRDRLRGIERRLDQGQNELTDLERRRARFLQEFRGLLERELGVVQVEEGRAPLESRAIEMDLGAPRGGPGHSASAGASVAASAPALVTDSDGPSALEAHAPTPESPAEDTAASNATAPTDAEPTAPDGATGPDGEIGVSDPEPLASTAPAEASSDVPEALDPPETTAAVPVPSPEGAPAAPAAQLRVNLMDETRAAVDVTDLQPEADANRPSAPPAVVNREPSSLELELMAGASDANKGSAKGTRSPFEGIPDLETVLAEAGVEEVKPPPAETIAPPAAPTTPTARPDNVILFDPDDSHRKKR